MLLVSTLPVAGGTIGDVKTYLNGVVTNAGTGTKAIDTLGNQVRPRGFGQRRRLPPSPKFLNGRIDDVAIWNVALTDDEIKGLYDVGNSSELAYTASDFDQLKQLHDAAGGSATVGRLRMDLRHRPDRSRRPQRRQRQLHARARRDGGHRSDGRSLSSSHRLPSPPSPRSAVEFGN
jgi:hypothetical protein